MNIFIDTENMEERYGEELYKDYLKEQLEKDKYIIGEQQQEIERLNNIIDELENKIWYLYNYASLDTSNLKKELQELKENK